MKTSYAWVSLALIFGVLINETFAASQARITLKVVDDEGLPQVDFPVNAGFYDGGHFRGLTDTNGLFIMDGQARINVANWVLQKEGYYYGQGTYILRGGVKDGKMQPWDPVVTTVVRRVVNPIPMYAKMVDARIPEENQLLGYDLIAGDWTSPHGAGKQTDLVFRFSRRITSDNDYEGSLRLSFVNPLDGILENHEIVSSSAFKFPRFAPRTGYETNWISRMGRDPTNGYFGATGMGEDKNWFIRVRSVKDENGTLKEALYGKICDQIRIRGIARKGDADIIFAYYLNPTPNDRNLEFDPKRNLMPNLKSTEQVTAP